MSIKDKYVELVELLETLGVLQSQDDWALEIQELIETHGVVDDD